MFAGFEIIPSNLLEEAVLSVYEKMNPISVCVGERDFENTLLQREWVRKKYDLDGKDIEVFKTPEWMSNKKVRDHINKEDFQSFKNSVPKPIAVMFNEFVKESLDDKKDKNDS